MSCENHIEWGAKKKEKKKKKVQVAWSVHKMIGQQIKATSWYEYMGKEWDGGQKKTNSVSNVW